MRPKEVLKQIEENIGLKSIQRALAEQKLLSLYNQLSEIVPDIVHQYSSFNVNNEYLATKVRGMHAFQIDLVKEALKMIKDKANITIVDIGDSSGTHIQYIKNLYQDRKLRCLSLNLDNEAVKRIKGKGLEVICARAEDLTTLGINADVFLSFEMLEHLMNPNLFLQNLSEKTNCKVFVITVPYLVQSRVGLHHIRQNQKKVVNPENTHIFELSPSDWKLVFRHSGWKVEAERIYLQYPRRSLFTPLLKNYWRSRDFEGFYGAILSRDKSLSELYNGWV